MKGRWLTWLVTIAIVMLGLVCLGMMLPLELAFYTLFGWLLFLVRVVPRITVDWSTVLVCVFCLVAFTGGLHAILGWFTAAMQSPDGELVSRGEKTRWKWRWTLSVVALIVMLFVAGTSMVGITHQLAWWMTTPGPKFAASSSAVVYRMQSSNHLKQIGLAMHLYHDVDGRLPPGCTLSPAGRAEHGWQAFLLPYFEQRPLYDQIDFAQAWDAPVNREAYSTRLESYTIGYPREVEFPTDEHGYPLTDYAANVHVLGGTRRMTLPAITDGTSETILAGEAVTRRRAWGHPANWRDPMDGIGATSDGFGGPWPGGTGGANFVMVDGSVQFLAKDVDPAVLRALATPAGGETIAGGVP